MHLFLKSVIKCVETTLYKSDQLKYEAANESWTTELRAAFCEAQSRAYMKHVLLGTGVHVSQT